MHFLMMLACACTFSSYSERVCLDRYQHW